MLAIAEKEWKSYFHSMTGWFVTAFMVLVCGIYFFAMNLGYGVTDFGYYTLYNTMFVFLVYVPVLTMRSLAEERRTRTDQLLLTSPVTAGQIVLGKFLAMCGVFLLPCLVYAGMILALAAMGASAASTAGSFACLLCYCFLGMAAIALGQYISGLTDNPVLAGIGSFAVLFLAYMMPAIQTLFTAGSALALAVFGVLLLAGAVSMGVAGRSPALGLGIFVGGGLLLAAVFAFKNSWLTEAFTWMMEAVSLFAPYEDFINQTFSLPALVYYVTATALLLFLTRQTLEKRRWH